MTKHTIRIGDLVQFRGDRASLPPSLRTSSGLIVDIVTDTETYTSSGCKRYVVLTARGVCCSCWQGAIEVIDESR